MQILLTILSGTSVFIFGQIILISFIKPINDFKIVLGEISHKVKFHSNVITNSGIKEELIKWSSGDMRDLSCQLESKYLIIPWSTLFSSLKIIPNRTNIREAASHLIRLANASGQQGYEDKNGETINKLKKLLKIYL